MPKREVPGSVEELRGFYVVSLVARSSGEDHPFLLAASSNREDEGLKRREKCESLEKMGALPFGGQI